MLYLSFQPELTDELKSSISTVRVISIIHQDELNVQIYPTNSGGLVGRIGLGAVGALIGATSDASINSARFTYRTVYRSESCR